MILQSIITCPNCGIAKMETMPTDACQYLYECTGCGTKLHQRVRALSANAGRTRCRFPISELM